MNPIVTFYSYKGGVGRSMALANVAVLLARAGLRVLVVDWDLEAPGLDNYFTSFHVKDDRPGLLRMVMDFKSNSDPDYKNYLLPVRDGDHSFDLLSSGKASDNQYSVNLEWFDWIAFFENGGGEFLESLREQWSSAYDVTLIDSRTGLSDLGGICTIQLPDIIVAMFSANHQSLYGVRDIMRLAQEARSFLAHDREQLSIVPLASRFGSDFRESKEWLDRTTEAMSEFYRDWLPAWANPREVVEQLKIPHVDYFGYGEKLAVVEQGTTDPQGMGFAYNKVANLLANNLTDAEKIFELKRRSDQTKWSLNLPSARPPSSETSAYEYDLYVSYQHSELMNQLLRPFVFRLKEFIGLLSGREIRIFLDFSVVQAGSSWPRSLESALLRSKLLLAIITPAYFRSKWAVAEWQTFEAREDLTKRTSPLIIPLITTSIAYAPPWFYGRNYRDVSGSFHARQNTLEIDETIRRVAEEVIQMLQDIPEILNPPLVQPKDIDNQSTILPRIWPELE